MFVNMYDVDTLFLLGFNWLTYSSLILLYMNNRDHQFILVSGPFHSKSLYPEISTKNELDSQ